MKLAAAIVLSLLLIGVCGYVVVYGENPLPLVADYLDSLSGDESGQAAAPPEPTPADTAPAMPPNTVPVSYLDCDFTEHAPAALAAVWQVITSRGIGTAFHVGNGRWLTAEHVIRGNRQVTLARAGQTITAEVVFSDRSGDTAILDTDSAPRSLSFGDLAEIGPGNHAYALGFPLYEAPTAAVSRGVVSRFYQDSTLGSIIQTDASVNPGNSGGPLLNECGEVIGMTVSKAAEDDTEGINYSIAAPVLEALLSGTGAPTVTARPAPTTTRQPATSHPATDGAAEDVTPNPSTDANSASAWQEIVFVEAGDKFVGIQLASTDDASALTFGVECSTGVPFAAVSFFLRPSTLPPVDGTAATMDFSNEQDSRWVRVGGATTYDPQSDEVVVVMLLADLLEAESSIEWTESSLVQASTFIGGDSYSAEFDLEGTGAVEFPECPNTSSTHNSAPPTTIPCPGVSQERWDRLDEMEANYMADFDERLTLLEEGSRAWRALKGSKDMMASQFEAQRFEMMAEHDAYLQACALAR